MLKSCWLFFDGGTLADIGEAVAVQFVADGVGLHLSLAVAFAALQQD
jgi:hypothetical protein